MFMRMKILGLLVGLLMAAGAQAEEKELGCYVVQPDHRIGMPHGRMAYGIRLTEENGVFAAHIQEVIYHYEKIVRVSDPIQTIAPLVQSTHYTGKIYLDREGIFALHLNQAIPSHVETRMNGQRIEAIVTPVKTDFPNFCGGLK